MYTDIQELGNSRGPRDASRVFRGLGLGQECGVVPPVHLGRRTSASLDSFLVTGS